MKKIIRRIPIIGSLAIMIKNKIFPAKGFTNSKDYWIDRYAKGGDSGAGSYNNLAKFKGDVINEFVLKNKIKSVIELGFGDGNQLKYFQFPFYTGFDISDTVIQKCRHQFKNDTNKKFMHMSDISNQKADMVMSLDVIYHLIEDETYRNYMTHLFDLSKRYVIIYAFDNEESKNYAPHVKPRKFTKWININRPDYKLIEHIPNKYPFDEEKPKSTSFADFYIYERIE
jgi:hypothetical protein